MKVAILTIVIAVLTVLLVYVIYMKGTSKPTPTSEAYFEYLEDVKDTFIKVATIKLSEITKCVLDDFLKKYLYSEADKLINEDAFKNNPEVLAALDKCTYNVLKRLYAFFVKTLEDACIAKKPDLAAKWVIDNVPYKVLTDEEAQQYLKKIKDDIGKTCWSDAVIAALEKKTVERLQALITAMLGEGMPQLVFSNKTYSDRVNTLSKLVLQTYASDQSSTPDAYAAAIEGADAAFFAKYSGNSTNFLFDHMSVINKLTPSWCKDKKVIVTEAAKLPFDAQINVEDVVAKLKKEFCWDPSVLTERTRKILENIL